VEKRARVVEEVKVGKKRSKAARTVQDTVRKTDVEVERVGASNQAAYHGPERRRNTTPYTGQDRRKAA
jgi:stress response protein YsnF